MMSSTGLGGDGVEARVDGMAECRQWEWQNKLQFWMETVDQSMWGLCSLNQGRPNTTGEVGDGIKKKEMFSWWLPDIIRLTGTVRWVTWARSLPSKANTSLGWGRSWQGMWICVAKHVSMKLSSAPESNRMDRGREVWSHETVPLIMTQGGDERIEEWLTNAPPVVDEPPLLAEPDSAPVDVHSARSRRRDPGAGDVDAPAEWVLSSPAA